MNNTKLTYRERAQLELMIDDYGIRAVLNAALDYFEERSVGRSLTATDIYLMMNGDADAQS
jgi:hypothetical protein